eukprot:4013777-Prymnesium_polylepis.1
MQRDRGPPTPHGPRGIIRPAHVGRHHARGHPAEEGVALVVAVSDDGRSIFGPPVDAPSHWLRSEMDLHTP